ncbi:uncharacterized protein MELLADRAFT_85422 [Melampsora larici-populina 98AG31]|uniref:GCM domain-containing protein n=1 Tax=Melampsora larici-populina (strain 98AG31 / pathotype 3-4-7) TaxID=747676 RepID=F4RIM3_MELLP|nr:uncharacterized protein MELLADRAFT_85422 [Melampsora larici-populina 98AG31]EGG07589.1 hypothetical protein MELLADRAFT_85422 [Melampsora larici-populina 98AG31]
MSSYSDFEEQEDDTYQPYQDGYEDKVADSEEEQDLPLPKAASQNSKSTTQSNGSSTINLSNKSNKPGKKGKKTFSLPQDRASFTTFIDDDTTVDDKGYPLLPNGNTVFVRQPDQKLVNWGTFQFTYTTSGGGTGKGSDWRTIRFTCLGVFICNDLDCRYRGSPPTSTNKRLEWISEHRKCPAARCPGVLQYLSCKNTICRLDEHIPSGWGIIRHSGIHNHPWPRRPKPDKLSLGKLGKKVVDNPDVGPLRLKVGRAPAGKQEIVTATSIHPAFGNLHRTGYYRRKLLVAAGVIPEKKIPGAGDSFILDMIHWSKRGLRMISCSFMPKDTHMTFQTNWMAGQLLSRDEDDSIYRGGLLSDVTYKFFANGYLLTTSMYNNVLNRWIPIQLTWLNGLTEEHYAAHFTTLMRQMEDARLASHITNEERDILVRQVVDFSVAQKNGFVMAYMDVFQEHDRQVALSKLKACHEHFRAQVTRVKRNRVIIPADDELRKEWPKAKKWIEWWQAADIQSMLFRSRPRQIDDDGLCDDLPATTNAQESMHRVYYMISEGNCTVQIGLVQLYALVGSLERDYDDLCKGVPIEYGGEAKNYKKVAQLLGWSKKMRKPRDVKNDGRPPDTTDELLGRPKKLGRPKGAVNVDRHPVTTYQGFVASTTPGRQFRCWLDAMTESLYAVHTPLWYHSPSSPAMTQTLFRVNIKNKLVCSNHKSHILNESNHRNSITLSHERFGGQFSYSDIPALLQQWTSPSGLQRVSARHCCTCRGQKDEGQSNPPYLERSQLHLDPPPPHLHINLDIAYLLGTRLFDEGSWIWGSGHYWCKVVQTVGALTGVWLNNDLVNAGVATLVSSNLKSIGGTAPNTTWAMYSREPTAEESKVIKKSKAIIYKAIGHKVKGEGSSGEKEKYIGAVAPGTENTNTSTQLEECFDFALDGEAGKGKDEKDYSQQLEECFGTEEEAHDPKDYSQQLEECFGILDEEEARETGSLFDDIMSPKELEDMIAFGMDKSDTDGEEDIPLVTLSPKKDKDGGRSRPRAVGVSRRRRSDSRRSDST